MKRYLLLVMLLLSTSCATCLEQCSKLSVSLERIDTHSIAEDSINWAEWENLTYEDITSRYIIMIKYKTEF